MAADDLNAPLGQDTTKKRSALPLVLGKAIVGSLGLFVILFALWAVFVDDPLGGEPTVVVSTDTRGQPAQKPDEITIVSAIPGIPAGVPPTAPPALPPRPKTRPARRPSPSSTARPVSARRS